MSNRLKAGIWVQAQLRVCDIKCISAMVVRKGDVDAGSVLLKLNHFSDGCAALVSITTMEGERAWMHGLKEGFTDERTVDHYIQKQIARDSDLWVLEIEDPKKLYELDGVLVQ
jgi:hypothetical protein